MKKLALVILLLCITMGVAACSEDTSNNPNLPKHVSTRSYQSLEEFEGKTFTYEGVSYELPPYAMEEDYIGNITGIFVLDDSWYLLIKADVNDDISYFAVFDTLLEEYGVEFTSPNVLWRDDDLSTLISFDGHYVINSWGERLGDCELTEGDSVKDMVFTSDNTKVRIEVKRGNGETEFFEFDIPIE